MRSRFAASLAPRYVVVAASIAALFVAFAPPAAEALPLYATRTGLACRACHFDPNGGGGRNEIGFQFEKNRHDLMPDVGKWADLALTNRVGDVLYFGTNLREQYTYVRQMGAGGTGVSTTFPMQGALLVTFSPHQQLVVSYNRDLRETRDAWLMLKDLPLSGYLRAGQIRVPFGLRMDDHTGAMRAGFRESIAGSFGTSGFLPFDPRNVEGGLEVGLTPLASSSLSAIAAISNGGPAFANKAQALTGKVYMNEANWHAGVSAYDNWQSTSGRRDTRYSAYGTLRVGEDVAFLGEIGTGRTELASGGVERPRGFFVEGDYRVNRMCLLRAKYDYIDLNHDVEGMASERYVAETDLTIVPFMDVKLSFRRVVPEDSADENQFLVQWHAYY
jgi:hypothetical protein